MSVFGNSASREAARIRARGRRGVWGHVTAWVGCNPEAAAADAVAARWKLGARAERKTARMVRPLRLYGWRLRHDRRLVGRRFNIDHAMGSPCGEAVVVADTKRWPVGWETVVGWDGRLWCGREERHGEAVKVARYAALVAEALQMPGVAVWPLLIVHGSTVPGGHVQVATEAGVVQVVAAGEVRRVLRAAPAGWSWRRARWLVARVDEVLTPYRCSAGGVKVLAAAGRGHRPLWHPNGPVVWGIAPGGGSFFAAHRLEHVNDMPPEERLAKLRALEEWLDYQLRTTRAKIRTLEAEMDRDRRAAKRAWEEQRWKLEPARDRRTVLHRGGCGIWKGGHGYVTREEVLLALEDDSLDVEMCSVCNPEPGLRP